MLSEPTYRYYPKCLLSKRYRAHGTGYPEPARPHISGPEDRTLPPGLSLPDVDRCRPSSSSHLVLALVHSLAIIQRTNAKRREATS